MSLVHRNERPRLLDLFCGAGGAGLGYYGAGFDVVGVDIEDQPRYPFEFHQADAMDFPLEGFDAIHASPPCQSYSRAMKHLADSRPMLIEDVRERLESAGVPWVIENVEGSPLPRQATLTGSHGVVLCGSSFGLRVRRHRLFQTNFPIPNRGCRHSGLAINPTNDAGRERIYRELGVEAGAEPDLPEKVWRDAMGVRWMDRYEGREAIPPAFTRYIGGHLMAAVQQAERIAA